MLLKSKADRDSKKEGRKERERRGTTREEEKATHFSGNETPISLATGCRETSVWRPHWCRCWRWRRGEGEEGTQQELTVTDDGDQADRQTDIDLGLRNAAESGAVSAAAFFGLSQFPLSLNPTPAVSVFFLSTFFFWQLHDALPQWPKVGERLRDCVCCGDLWLHFVCVCPTSRCCCLLQLAALSPCRLCLNLRRWRSR